MYSPTYIPPARKRFAMAQTLQNNSSRSKCFGFVS